MKVVKPTRVGLLHRVFENGREHYLVVSTYLFFPLTDPKRLLTDVSLWKTAAEEVRGGVLDLGMPKPSGEMLVDGSAFAGPAPRPACHVRARVGEIDKTLLVMGDRHWTAQGPSDPEPFSVMCLSWERSFGGPSFAKNPLGKGARPVNMDGRSIHPLPNIEDPKRPIQSKDEKPDPAGLTAHDITWPERASKLGTYDGKWLKERFPGYAADLDLSHFNAASRDQRLDEGYFACDAPFTVESMHPTASSIQGSLPGLKPRVFVTQVALGEESWKELECRLDTVHLFPSIDRAMLVFRSLLRIAEDDAEDILHLVVGCEETSSPKPIGHYRDVLERRLERSAADPVQSSDDELLPRSFASEPIADDPEFARMTETKGLRAANADRGAAKLRRERSPAPTPASSGPTRPEDVAHEERGDGGAQKGPVGPPRYSAQAEHDSALERVALARRAGIVIAELEARVAAPDYLERLRRTELHLETAYRKSGHHQAPAPPASREASAAHRERLRVARSLGIELRDRDFTGADLSKMDLSGIDLEGAFLEGADLRETKLDRANLRRAVLVRADLTDATLEGACLESANLAESSLVGTRLDGADLTSVELASAKLVRTSLVRATLGFGALGDTRLEAVDLSSAVIRDLTVVKTSFASCNLSNVDWERGNFVECDFEGSTFDGARLERTTFLQSKLDGVSFRNARLHRLRLVKKTTAREACFRGADLTMANLRSIDLAGADFTEADLSSADLSGSSLAGARFYRAVAKDARFVRANCTATDFTSANLMRAILQKAGVARATFLGANLFRADLALAKGDAETSFAEANVTQVRFIEGAK